MSRGNDRSSEQRHHGSNVLSSALVPHLVRSILDPAQPVQVQEILEVHACWFIYYVTLLKSAEACATQHVGGRGQRGWLLAGNASNVSERSHSHH